MLTYGRACSRSEKLMRASLFSRSIAAFNVQFSIFNFQLINESRCKGTAIWKYLPKILCNSEYMPKFASQKENSSDWGI